MLPTGLLKSRAFWRFLLKPYLLPLDLRPVAQKGTGPREGESLRPYPPARAPEPPRQREDLQYIARRGPRSPGPPLRVTRLRAVRVATSHYQPDWVLDPVKCLC